MRSSQHSQSSELGYQFEFDAIGTRWLIESDQSLDDDLKKQIQEDIEKFDAVYSRFRGDSLVAELSQSTGTFQFPEADRELLKFYHDLYVATNGAVSPLIGNTLVEAGYDKDYSLRPRTTVYVAPKWEEVIELNGSTMTMKLPATLDFGAAGKGWLVDRIGEMLERNNHTSYVIDGSGDIRVRGRSERIGLENPFNNDEVIGYAVVENGSLCASATNRRRWGEWHHIVDPRNARPVKDIVATWVISEQTYLADGIATALFFVDPDELSRWHFDYIRMNADGSVEHSPGIVGQLFT